MTGYVPFNDLRAQHQRYGGRPEEVARVTLVHLDAASLLEKLAGKFDIIIVDFPGPNSEELAKLYSRLFYRRLADRLAVLYAKELVGEMSEDDKAAFTRDGWREGVSTMYPDASETAILEAAEALIAGECQSEQVR